MKMNKIMSMVLEDSGDAVKESVKTLETEVIVYAKISNFDGLQKASLIEVHEQMETSFKNGIRCRVRKVDDEGYTFTFKIPTSDEEGVEANEEVTTIIDKDFYEGFRGVAEHRLLKTRYEFSSDKIQLLYGEGDDRQVIEIPDIKYEVDVYTNTQGEVCEWCKIDIEVDAILDYLSQHHSDLEQIKLNIKLSHLPFEPIESILSTSMTDDQKAFVDSLWHDQFHLTPIVSETDKDDST